MTMVREMSFVTDHRPMADKFMTAALEDVERVATT
jgi:hypothetical protein